MLCCKHGFVICSFGNALSTTCSNHTTALMPWLLSSPHCGWPELIKRIHPKILPLWCYSSSYAIYTVNSSTE